MEWFEFVIEDKPFHIETRYVFQVLHEATVTPVPFVPDCYLGLAYYRGELYDVIQMSSLMGEKKRTTKDIKRTLILLKWDDKKLALAPDKVVGLIHVDIQEEDKNLMSRKSEELNRITPELIISKLLKEQYGPVEIREDIRSGSREISR